MIGARFVEYLEGQSRNDQTAREAGGHRRAMMPTDFAGQVDNRDVGSGEQ